MEDPAGRRIIERRAWAREQALLLPRVPRKRSERREPSPGDRPRLAQQKVLQLLAEGLEDDAIVRGAVISTTR